MQAKISTNLVPNWACEYRARDDNTTKISDRIISSTRRMSNMVSQLLDLTRIRLGNGIAIESKPTDPATVVSEVIDEMKLSHPGRDIDWKGCDGERYMLDPDRFAQIVSNLVGNALQHGDASSTIAVQLSTGRTAIGLVVHNHGPPIPPVLLPVLFDPFRDTADRGSNSGLGLGLFITQHIVLAHGGSIDVQSTAEEGTTIAVTLPARHTRPTLQKLAANKDQLP